MGSILPILSKRLSQQIIENIHGNKKSTLKVGGSLLATHFEEEAIMGAG
jgi:hypothetical protein